MTIDDQLYLIWSKLSEFSAEETDEAALFLMSELAQMIDADNVCWVGAVKLSSTEEQATVGGWRPKLVRYLHPHQMHIQNHKKVQQRLAKGAPDQTSVAIQKEAGTFRVLLWREMLPAEWFKSEAYEKQFGHRDIRDHLFVVFPVNSDTESTFCFQKVGRDDRFSRDDVKIIRKAMRPLRWFHRQLLLCYGLILAEKPLSPTEREVQKLLLTELSEKEIAARLGQSITTTHQHVTTIFRKMGVKGRAGLASLWLGA